MQSSRQFWKVLESGSNPRVFYVDYRKSQTLRDFCKCKVYVTARLLLKFARVPGFLMALEAGAGLGRVVFRGREFGAQAGEVPGRAVIDFAFRIAERPEAVAGHRSLTSIHFYFTTREYPAKL